MEINTQVLKGHIDAIILALLADRDMYGYELAEEVQHRSNGDFQLKEGTMYVSLKRLEIAGLVESYWGGTEGGGARRKYYHLRIAGHEQLAQRRAEWVFVKSVVDTFLGRDEK
ncbi:PadR family transcriptional regulator [Alicyclobacillus sp. ALC3]|uniref:PadR family transcriptional regulator n=1 Tax=Alicyclobacillus sp. ALC3 TaxID=2796143 RepID=UPI0023797C65|nr:PadR family transcriptional regulator [Alicyclobacillus sp. ALC3]WDL96160.1 PadR family transcriptional regulator [Alicyclobacillus sp. ALC3]